MTTSPFDDLDDSDSLDPLESYEELYNQNRELLDATHLMEEAVPEVEDAVGLFICLFDIYSEIESMDEAGRCLVEAARRVDMDHHNDLIYFLYNQLELFAQLSPDAEKNFLRLGQLISEDSGKLEANTLHLDQRKLYQVDLIPEVLLANHLHRSRILTDMEYHTVLQDLCWMSSKAPLAPRACQYVLEDRSLPHTTKAIEFMAHDAGAPYIDLTLMHFDPEKRENILPLETCRRRAACVFGEVGGEPLVAVLNPFNLQLQEDVGRLLEADPHYFVCSAKGYQHVLDSWNATA